jgi:hypothetical protein
MIKFEEHEGKLFKMLDEPVPLKENDENVLVRFITHGVIGEYVMEHWLDNNQENVPIYVEDVDSDGDVTVWIDENRNEHHCCPFPMFEIIGIHVKEGSDDWAWYKMIGGEKIMCAGMNSQRFYAIKEGCDYCALYENDGNEVRINTKRTYDEFIEYSKMCGISSWEIYKEPKEEQQPVKEPIANCKNCKHVCTNSNIDHCHMYEPKHESENIIHGHIPADIVIHIGCLSGTVKDLSYAEDGRFWFIGKKTERCPGGMYAILYEEMLDAETRELVEGLLKAQNEEKLKGDNNDWVQGI